MTPRPTTLELGAGRLLLDGTPSVLLCSSVFPFRIPSEQWDHRLQLVQESGYRMVDLYVHWGFHEQVPGTIDLSSPERDLARFLELAAARDLLVMARPGPYICSETDGGGLPWWLHGDAATAPAALRTTDPAYLEAVDRWFDAVMPILAAAQIDRGGPVALVQIETELDFFDCPDPEDYMAHLVERTRAHGIEVPIIACAGQGDLAGASGDAEHVVPTVNLYPSDTSRSFDAEARHYAAELASRNLPLMVTETNRMHRTLRREILAGARLVAPYLQTSGFDHLVLPSAGNWGDPGNLMTHDYDFDGYLTPDGRRRPEYDEAVALGATLAAWGDRLATALPVPLDSVAVDGIATGGALALDGGGFVVGPAELDDLATAVLLRPSGSTAGIAAVLAPGTCPFWALDVPLEPWGAEGTLTAATAELIGVRPPIAGTSDSLVLTFEGGVDAHVALELAADGGEPEHLVQTGPGEARSQSARIPVRLIVQERADSLADPEPVLARVAAHRLPVHDALAELGTVHPLEEGAALPGAERLGLADGRVRAEFELSAEATEVLVLEAADLVRLELDGTDHGVSVTHGAPRSLPLAPGTGHALRVDAEIWGRANFDDARRPALHLGAGRGTGQVLQVLRTEDVSDAWEVRRIPDRRSRGDLAAPPLRELGGWSSARPGRDTLYGRALGPVTSSAVLRLVGLTHPVHVALDGGEETLVVPDAPVLVLPGAGSGAVDVTVRTPHVPGGLLERVELLTVVPARCTRLRTLAEADLAAELTAVAAASAEEAWTAVPAAFDGLRVGAGRPVLLRLEGADRTSDQGLLLELAGQDVEVTVLAGGRRVSRHVLGEPVVGGGPAGRSWVPASWCGPEGGEVLLLVEAIEGAGGIFEGARRAATSR